MGLVGVLWGNIDLVIAPHPHGEPRGRALGRHFDMLFSRDADTVPDMAEEEVKLTRRVQLFVGDVSSADEAPVGELSITTAVALRPPPPLHAASRSTTTQS